MFQGFQITYIAKQYEFYWFSLCLGIIFWILTFVKPWFPSLFLELIYSSCDSLTAWLCNQNAEENRLVRQVLMDAPSVKYPGCHLRSMWHDHISNLVCVCPDDSQQNCQKVMRAWGILRLSRAVAPKSPEAKYWVEN